LQVAKPVTDFYLNPLWASYNAGLAKLAEGGEAKIASGCGHFIQKDNPDFVATELGVLLDQVIAMRGK
jgi:hypothetical protein